MANPKIKTIQVGDKSRYRFVVDIGIDPVTGKRRQQTKTFDRKRDAEAALAKIVTGVDQGTYAGPTKVTVGEYLDEWLRSAVRGKEANTESAYRHGIQPAKDRLGAKPLQKLTTADVEDLVDWMLTAGRKRGGKKGTPLSPRAVQITLSKLRTALEAAVDRQLVTRNVAKPVKCPAQVKAKRTPWSDAEIQTFLTSIATERLYAPLLMALCGLRPEEVCGLRWAQDVDLDAATISISNVRTLVWGENGGQVVEKGPKTAAGERTLPLPTPVLAGLRALKAAQAAERLAAGEAYEPTGYVLVDELGRPYKTDQLRREVYRLMTKTKVRKVRLYDARSACLTHLHRKGVPIAIIAAWAGHADGGVMALRAYIRVSQTDLMQASDVLNELFAKES